MFPTTLDTEVLHFLGKWYTNEWLELLIQKLSVPPSKTTLRVNLLKVSREELLQKLNHLFAPYIEKHGRKFEAHPVLEELITIDCVGPLSVQRNTDKEIIVSRECAEAVLRGADIFSVGVMGASNNLSRMDKVSVLADVDGIVTIGEAINGFKGKHLFIGNGIMEVNRKTLLNSKRGLGVKMTERIFESPPMNDVFTDLLYLQNLPSVITAKVLNPQPNDVILDMCAAPGGKTTHIACLCQNKAKIYALDKNATKVKSIQKTCNKLGVTCVEAIHLNAAKSVLPSNTEFTIPQKGFPRGFFDKILLDPPCSGLGNRPRLKDTSKVSDLKAFADFQYKLFKTGIELLKPGGILVYSTCTLNPEENEEIVAKALFNFKDLLLVEQVPYLGEPGIHTSSMRKEDLGLVQRFDPTGTSDTIGFFVAKFKKKG